MSDHGEVAGPAVVPAEAREHFAKRTAEWFRAAARVHWPFLVLTAVTIVFQAAVFSGSRPNVFPDSGAYMKLADSVAARDWKEPWFTFRTPGFPAVIAFTNHFFGHGNWSAVMGLQFLCGSFIPLLLYAIYFIAFRRPGLAAIGGAAFLLDRYSVGLQTVPLTEFLSGMTVILCIAAYLGCVRRKAWWTAPVLGLLFFINLMIRPSFQLLYLCVIGGDIFVEMMYRETRQNWRRTLAWNAIFLVTVQFGIWCWSSVVYRQTGVRGVSLQLGASMTNMTGPFMELGPDEHAKIRDIYVRERNARKGNHVNLFDQVAWMFEHEAKLNRWQASLEFKAINKYLILHYPGKYLRMVAEAWGRLWTDDSRYQTDITDPDGSGTGRMEATAFFRFVARNQILRKPYAALDFLLFLNKTVLALIPYLLLVVGGVAVYIRRKDSWSVLAIALVVGTVMYHMVLHAMVQFTEYGRYKLPVQPLWFSFIAVTGAWGVLWVWRSVKRQVAEGDGDGARETREAPTQARRRRGNKRRQRGGHAAQSPHDLASRRDERK